MDYTEKVLLVFIAAHFTMVTVFDACRCHDYDRCSSTPDKPILCDDNNCHECCTDDDCSSLFSLCDQNHIACNDNFECECNCYYEGESCQRQFYPCCSGLACDVFTNTCVSPCSNDADCRSRTKMLFSDDLSCKNGVCDFEHCNTNSSCQEGHACFYGDCVTIPECDDIDFCIVMPSRDVTGLGTTSELTASAFTKTGALAPGMNWTWSTGNTNIASVSNGVVTGQAESGEVTVTATVLGCNISCDAAIRNYPSVGTGNTRVLVLDEDSGIPVSGATVSLRSEPFYTTDENGIVEFSEELSESNPADITVSHAYYNYVTFRNVKSRDLLVLLESVNDSMKAGGVYGKLAFDMIRCEGANNCDVQFAIGGTSIKPKFDRLTLDSIIGDWVSIRMNLGGYDDFVSLPASFVLCLNVTCFKEAFYPVGTPGTRISWAIGGRIGFSFLVDKLSQDVLSGNEVEVGANVLDLLPLFTNFRQGTKAGVEVVSIPKVVDVMDINGNDMDDDYVPDYFNFPLDELLLRVPTEDSMTFYVSDLPLGTYDSVLIIPVVVVPGAGLVPMGISAGVDSTRLEDRDGIIDKPIMVNVAELSGQIPEDNAHHAILVLAFNIESISSEDDFPLRLAVKIIPVDGFQGSYTLEPFMTPSNVTYDSVNRVLDVIQLSDGVDCTQIYTTDNNGAAWHIFSEANIGPLSLPQPPLEGDRALKAQVISMKLREGFTCQDLPSFNDVNFDNILDMVDEFSITAIP